MDFLLVQLSAGLHPQLRECSKALGLLPINQRHLRFECVAFCLIPQFVGALVNEAPFVPLTSQ